MKKMKVVEKVKICKLGSVPILVHNSPKEATELARKGPKFPRGPKLEGFTVPI
jgi:hypothetical protein